MPKIALFTFENATHSILDAIAVIGEKSHGLICSIGIKNNDLSNSVQKKKKKKNKE